MKKRLLIMSALLFLTTAPAIAEWQYGPPTRTYPTYPARAYNSQSDWQGPPFSIETVIGFMFGIGFAAAMACSFSRSAKDESKSRNLPLAPIPRPSPEHYDQQATRARAQARLIDAETELYQTMLRQRWAKGSFDEPDPPPPGPKSRGR